MTADRSEQGPSWFSVTDDDLDAPDGAQVWMNGVLFERQGQEWVMVDPPHIGRMDQADG